MLGISARTIQRWQLSSDSEDRRKGPHTRPAHSLRNDEKDRIIALANQPAFRNLSAEQVVATLADNGTYVCSERSLRRVLAERHLDRYRLRSKPAHARNNPRQYVACEPLRLVSWDITYLRNASIRGSFFYLYVFVDVWSRRILATAVHETQESELAAEVLESLCATHAVDAEKLVLHSDNGAPMKGCTMLALMQSLGITASFSRPGVSDDNAFVESLFRHLKYAPSYPRDGFTSLEAARKWVARFRDWYNSQHLHSAIGFVTPDDRHHGRDIAILERRREVYAAAQARNPHRWTTAPRTWSRPETVTLNPERTLPIALQAASAAA